MKQVLNVYKPIGLTPLQLIQKLQKEKPEYKNIKIGFAGRLDPLAHGVMLLLIGDETKNKDQYLNLPKEYEFEVLFGISSDTYDALGLLNNLTIQQPALPAGRFNNLDTNQKKLKKQIDSFIKTKLGKQIQTYPPFSSKTVNGKPLYWYARNNKLGEIEIPKREIDIYNFELINVQTKPVDEIKKIIIENINSVDGDFRQKEILKKWKKFFEPNKNQSFTTAKFKTFCSSGTYVRSLANDLGTQTKTGAIALEILRTKVGDYSLERSARLNP